MNTSLRRHRTTHRAVVITRARRARPGGVRRRRRRLGRPRPRPHAESTEAPSRHGRTRRPPRRRPTPPRRRPTPRTRPTRPTATTDASRPPRAVRPQPMRIGFLPPGLEIPAFQGLWHGTRGIRRRALRRRGRRRRRQVRPDRAGPDDRAVGRARPGRRHLDHPGRRPRRWHPTLQAATDAGIVVIAGGVPADYGFDSPPPGMTFANIDNARVRRRDRRDDGRLCRRTTRRRGSVAVHRQR